MAPVDPNDYALAAITLILDQPAKLSSDAMIVAVASQEKEIYSRIGPGPFDAIRVKWAARATNDGDFVVDETVGGNSIAVTSIRMTHDAAIQFIDDRAHEAQQRFEQLRNDMGG